MVTKIPSFDIWQSWSEEKKQEFTKKMMNEIRKPHQWWRGGGDSQPPKRDRPGTTT